MRKLLVTALFLTSTLAAQAQEAAEFTLKLTSVEVNQIGRALGTQPYNEVAALLTKLQTQVIEQQKPKAVEPKPTDAR